MYSRTKKSDKNDVFYVQSPSARQSPTDIRASVFCYHSSESLDSTPTVGLALCCQSNISFGLRLLKSFRRCDRLFDSPTYLETTRDTAVSRRMMSWQVEGLISTSHSIQICNGSGKKFNIFRLRARLEYSVRYVNFYFFGSNECRFRARDVSTSTIVLQPANSVSLMWQEVHWWLNFFCNFSHNFSRQKITVSNISEKTRRKNRRKTATWKRWSSRSVRLTSVKSVSANMSAFTCSYVHVFCSRTKTSKRRAKNGPNPQKAHRPRNDRAQFWEQGTQTKNQIRTFTPLFASGEKMA